MDIDLSTPEEIQLRFNQICAYFAMLVRDKVEPQNDYLELYHAAEALKKKFSPKPKKYDCLMCSNSYSTDDEDGNPILVCFEFNDKIVDPEQQACERYN